MLKDLDNIDKHRQLWVVATSARRATSVADEGRSQLVNAKWTRRPFTHKQKVAILTYDPPLNKLDPTLKLMSYVAFGEGPREDTSVTGSLAELIYFIEDDLIPRFSRFFPPKRRATFEAVSYPWK